MAHFTSDNIIILIIEHSMGWQGGGSKIQGTFPQVRVVTTIQINE